MSDILDWMIRHISKVKIAVVILSVAFWVSIAVFVVYAGKAGSGA